MSNDPFLTRFEGPAPESRIAIDLVKRALPVAPLWLIFCGLVWGADGVWSAGYGLGLVLVNFLLAGALTAAAARISIGLVMGAALGGYLIRLGLIFVAVLAVAEQNWIEVVALGLTIVIAHLGLLLWELRFVSATLAYPSLKPSARSER